MKKIFFSLFLFFIVFVSTVYAQRGCCSWHVGVCGCAGISKLCCDGTLSPSCLCSSVYIPPKPKPTFPSDIQASYTSQPNNDGSTFDIVFNLQDSNPTEYSTIISKCAGCDPGPLPDFNTQVFIYQKVNPGTWYANVKKKINGEWSNVVYYMINIPEWYQPPTATPIPIETSSTNNTDLTTPFFIIIGLFIALPYGISFLIKRFKRS